MHVVTCIFKELTVRFVGSGMVEEPFKYVWCCVTVMSSKPGALLFLNICSTDSSQSQLETPHALFLLTRLLTLCANIQHSHPDQCKPLLLHCHSA